MHYTNPLDHLPNRWFNLLFFFLRMGHTGAELMAGMGDMKGILQPIMIRAINTESLSQRDPVPGPVSTLTGPLPGQNYRIMYSFMCTF